MEREKKEEEEEEEEEEKEEEEDEWRTLEEESPSQLRSRKSARSLGGRSTATLKISVQFCQRSECIHVFPTKRCEQPGQCRGGQRELAKCAPYAMRITPTAVPNTAAAP